MVLLGLLATVGLVHGFVHRRRAYLWLFGVCLALMLYTQGSALLYWLGAAVALVFVWRSLPDGRAGFVRDAALCFGGAAIVFLPWLPTTIDQIAHATNPWHYTPLLGATVPSQLLGSERVDVTLLVCVVIAVAPLATRARRRTPEAAIFWALIAIPAVALAVGRIVGFFVPIWAWRYFAPVVAPLLLLGALSTARARIVGVAAIFFCVAFLANAGSFAPSYKSDMQDLAAEMDPLPASRRPRRRRPARAGAAGLVLPAARAALRQHRGPGHEPLGVELDGSHEPAARCRSAGNPGPLGC